MNEKGCTSLAIEAYVCLTNMQVHLAPTPINRIMREVVGNVLGNPCWMKMTCKLKIQRKEGERVGQEGRTEGSNKLSGFVVTSSPACEDQRGLTLSNRLKGLSGLERAGAV